MSEQLGQDAARVAAVDDLIDALRAFTVESDVFVDVFARAHGLGRTDLNAIMWISVHAGNGRPLSAGELAGMLGLGAPATTALVDRLETAGHVRRQRDPRDRRRVTIDMQPTARELAARFFVPVGRLMNEGVADIPADELSRATAVVRRMIGAVTTARLAAETPDRGTPEGHTHAGE